MTEPLTAWIREVAPRARAYAISLVRNRVVAEDLVQDCFQRLLAGADRYDLPADGTKLLFAAVTRACINWTQRRPPEVSFDCAAVAGTAVGPVEGAIYGELSAAVDAALAELPLEQKAAVELSAFGHSAAEIAEVLQTTPGNARVLLHRGRQTLTQRLKPFLEES